MGFVEWLKFYFLGFFSEKQAKKAHKTGALSIILSAAFAFLLFLRQGLSLNLELD